MTWAEHIITYYKNLRPPQVLPNEISWLYPQRNEAVLKIVEIFYNKYFNDQQQRTLMLGINPGRLGAGITGVNFTAARQLQNHCGITHPFKNLSELSAEFIYEMIEAFGGAQKFYTSFFIGSVCPLGFVQHGKNLNYYDDKALLATVAPFIVSSMQQLLAYGVNTRRCICIGGEKNYKHLLRLNEKHNWFQEIVSVPHPRFIMQYRRKQKDAYLQTYLDALKLR